MRPGGGPEKGSSLMGDKLIKEKWLEVPGFPGYLISNFGRLRMKFQYDDDTAQRVRGIRVDRKPRSVKLRIREGRGGNVVLRKNNKNHWFKIAQLVLLAFIGPKTPGQVARHLDDNVDHNWLANLAWGSHKDNYDDAVRHGRHGPGSPGALERGHRLRGKPRSREVCEKISKTKRAFPNRQCYGGERNAQGRWKKQR